MKKLLVVMLLLLLAGFAFSAGTEEQASAQAPAEYPEISFYNGVSGFGPYDNAAMPDAVAWAQKMFGMTPVMDSIPSGSTWIQALNLKMADGEFPDVIHLGWGMDTATRNLVNSLADEGKIQPLTKYFNMPNEFPTLAKFDRALLKGYMHNGEVYAFPGWLSTVDADAPPWPAPMWIVRKDLALANLSDPVTSADTMYGADRLYAVLKQAQGMTDGNGDPVIPLGMQPADDLAYITDFIKEIKGAGWEVDAQGHYIPFWATEEIHDSLQFVNKLWAEGMMDPGFWTLKVDEYKEQLQKSAYGMSLGWTWNVGQTRNVYDAAVKDNGKDSEAAKAVRKRMYVMAQFPNKEPGKHLSPITTSMMGPIIISSAIDATPVMKFLEYEDTDEGTISLIADAGILGVDWEWVDGPQMWQMIGTDGSQAKADGPRGAAGAWTSTAAFKPENPPRVYPGLIFFSGRSYASYYPRVYRKLFEGYAKDKNWPAAELNNEPGGLSCLETQHPEMWKPVVSPIPSYKLFSQDLEPLELSMLTTMDNRWKEGLADVVTASDFEGAYKKFIDSLISVGKVKQVYEKLQGQYEAWLKENGDDRGDMGAGTVIPEWKAVMGW